MGTYAALGAFAVGATVCAGAAVARPAWTHVEVRFCWLREVWSIVSWSALNVLVFANGEKRRKQDQQLSGRCVLYISPW